MRKREGTGIPGKSPKRLGLFSSARSQFARRLVRMVLPIDFGGALQRFGDAVANIFRADVAFELRLLHQLRRLFTRSAQKQRASRSVQRVGKIANGAQASGVNRGHIAETKDNDGRQFIDGMENVSELVRSAKKKRAMNAVNNRVVRNILALQDVYAAVFHIVLGHGAHSR